MQLEVFNILFIREQEKRHVVHCLDCARKQSPNLDGFVCLEEYKIEELMEVFDNFVLHSQPVAMVRVFFQLALVCQYYNLKFTENFQILAPKL